MALHERIAELRHDGGLSQEQLAERLGVSRQSVSKWESSAAQPELDKVVAISRLFGVSTDSLLIGETLLPAPRKAAADALSEPEAREYLAARREYARNIAWGVALCVASPAPLLALEVIDRPWAEAVGVVVLLELVALAVYLFIVSGMRLERHRAIDRGECALSPEAADGIEAERRFFKPRYTQSIAFGVGLCVVSPVPVTLAGILDRGEPAEGFCCALLLLAVAAGTFLFVRDGMIMGSLNRLLKLSPKR